MWPQFELIQVFMVVFIACKNEDPLTIKVLEWSQLFSNCKSMGK